MNSSVEIITTVLICSFVGMVGQLFRVAVGLYKVISDDANVDKPLKELMNYQRLIVSIIIGLLIGTLSSFAFTTDLSKSDIMAILLSGYAGTDSIEGIFITAGAKKI